MDLLAIAIGYTAIFGGVAWVICTIMDNRYEGD